MSQPVHRPAEHAAVTTLLDSLPAGPRGLQVEGEPGIGKTTLAESAIAQAREAEIQVTVARVGQPETALSYAALTSLLDGVPEEAIDALPAPQRDALEIALLRRPDTGVPTDPRAVAVASLGVMRAVAAAGPVLVVVDDTQWLDRSSNQVMGFVVRHLDAEPVGILATRRIDPSEPAAASFDLTRLMGPTRAARIEVGAMSATAFGAMFRDQLGLTFPRSLTRRIHTLAEGNPFFGQEIAREIARQGVPGPAEPLPVPDDTLRLVQERAAALPAGTRSVLQVVAAASRPTTELVGQCVDGVDVDAALDEAERSGLIGNRAGRLFFRHPIFASAISATTAAPERRAVHRRIAAIARDPEGRARHLALSSSGPDAATAEALDLASLAARGRGAPAAAAELALLARDHTPATSTGQQIDRQVTVGVLAFEAGDAQRGHDLLDDAIEAMEPGPARASVINLVTELTWQDTRRIESLAQRALVEAGDDHDIAASTEANLAWVWMYRGDLGRATTHATRSLDLARRGEDPAVGTDSLTIAALVDFLRGAPFDGELTEAIDLLDRTTVSAQSDGSTVYSTARVVQGLLRLWEGDFATARRVLGVELATYDEQGRYVARDEILCYLAHVALRTGGWDAAADYIAECLEIGEDSGHLLGRGQNIVPRAWLNVLRGDLAAGRRDADEGIELSSRYGDEISVVNARGVLGLAALSEGDTATAAEQLAHVVTFLRDSGTVQPGVAPFVADAIEALVGCGRLDEAAALVDDDRLTGRLAPRRLLVAPAARATALLTAAQGELDLAAKQLTDLVDDPLLARQPFEHGRALLSLGEVERRRKQRSSASAHLDAARAVFDRLGAPLWSARAAEGLARAGSSSGSGSGGMELTPTEVQLVDLVVDGHTNAEAAARLFISVKTVEANLSRIYRKLGVRGRSELVRRVSQDPDWPLG